MKNFCNVIRFYQKINYYCFFNIISIQKSLSFNNDSNSFIDETSLKSKSNFFIKISQRQRFFVKNVNDFSIFFNQRKTSSSTSNFFLIFKINIFDANNFISRRQITKSKFIFRSSTNFRRQINDVISAKKALYYHFIDFSSFLFSNIDMIISSNQLQRMINVVIDNYIQRHSFVFEFFESAESSKSRNVDDFDDINADDNVNVN